MTTRILTVLLVLLLAAPAALAQAPFAGTRTDVPTFPQGLEGERFRMLIDAFNTKNLTLAQQFYDQHLADEFKARFPVDSYTEGYQHIASTTGGLDFHCVRTYDPPRPGVTTLICRDRLYGSWWAVAFHYGENPEDGLTDMVITRARMPADVAATRISEAELADELGGMLDRICEAKLFSGTVLVARGNDVIFERACGEADRSSHASVIMNTKFDIGSLSKMFTSVAIAQLAERGKLSFDDPLSKFLDESWLPATIADIVTVHYLLTHTSGLGDFLDYTVAGEGTRRLHAVDDCVELVRGDSLRFEPGTDWSYSSAGFVLLGAVVEKAGGEDYFDYMRNHVFGPAGMNDTDSFEGDLPVEGLAVGYSPSADSDTGWKENPPAHSARGCPGSGGFSSAPDLFRFTQALASGVLVSGESVQRMWTDYQEGDSSYGYGFMLRQSPKGLVVGHDGGSLGTEGYYDVYVGTGHMVVVLTNLDGAAWPVHARIGELMERLE